MNYTAEGSNIFENGELIKYEMDDWEIEIFIIEWEGKWNRSIEE